MPDRKMLVLCRRISEEKEPIKLLPLVEELIQLLDEEQDVIRAKIRAQTGTNTVPANSR